MHRMAEMTFDRVGYVELLGKLIGENRFAAVMWIYFQVELAPHFLSRLYYIDSCANRF